METEREKKDKLASARKKLNQYKLSRSGTTGHTSPPTVASSQPADVPLFYQNINSPAASFSIFNPAAINNNVTTSTSSGFSPVTFPGVVPETPIESSNGSDSAGHENVNFTPVTTNSIQFDNVASFNPFGPPIPATQYVEQPSGKDLSGSRSMANSSSQNESPLLFSPENNTIDLQSGDIEVGEDATEAHGVPALNNIRKAENDIHDSLNFSPSNTKSVELFPSAPIYEPTIVDENSKQITTDEPSPVFRTEDYPTLLPETSQFNDSRTTYANASEESETAHGTFHQGASIPVFASSLFGASNNEMDSIFAFGKNSQEPIIQPTVEPLTDNSIVQSISDVNPLFKPNLDVEEMSVPLFGDSALSETVLEETNISSSEANLELEVRNAAANESQPLVHEEKPTDLITQSGLSSDISPESVEPFSVVQSYASLENSDSQPPLQHEENYLVQPEAPNDSLAASQEALCQMRSVQEALELQIDELRRENTHLLGRQTELTLRIEESEKLAHEFKLEKDRVREEAATTSQALRARINSLCEENQRIVKNSTDVGVDLRAKLEEKSKQLEEMQKAVIIVSQSKMDFAGRLDHELERVKELQNLLKQKDDELDSLRAENSELQEKLKQDYQRDAIIHQLQDQARHYQVQCETLQRESVALRNKLKSQQVSPLSSAHGPNEGDNGNIAHSHGFSTGLDTGTASTNESNSNENPSEIQIGNVNLPELHTGECHNHSHEVPMEGHQGGKENLQHSDCTGHDHGDHHHPHVHDHGVDHHHHTNEKVHHDHQHHDHADEHNHHHDHDHGTDHHHHHHDHDHHDHNHQSNETVVARRGPSDEMTELKKTLHRLEWENSSFRNEIDVLAVDAKQKRTYEEKCAALEQENQQLKKEVEQLEHVIIQLQGENDTIGDYITLYQTQRMALKECAKEKDAQLELLAREREMLLHRLSELTALVKDLRESKSEAGSQCADDHMHTLDSSIASPPNKRQIEGKIRDLLTEISSSSLIENFHPCAVCSGRLMTV